MTEKIYKTPLGEIHYWVNICRKAQPTLIFLPGLTADHRLFDRQIEYFENRYNVLVWDAPAHGASWPFKFDFQLRDKAVWLEEILKTEEIDRPVIVGQSMGGYVGQMYSQLYPQKLKGFMAVDSAPLQRRYITAAELWLLKKMEPVYRYYPWKRLLKTGSKGVAQTEYGRNLMYKMMMEYDGDQERYAKISGHGFLMLANAIERDLPYKLYCPSMIIYGEKDRAGSCKRYCKSWHKNTGISIYEIKNAGHNSNTDRPEQVNRLIEMLINQVKRQG